MKSNDNHNHKVTDMNSKTTRVLSIDMGQEVVDFLRKENRNHLLLHIAR